MFSTKQLLFSSVCFRDSNLVEKKNVPAIYYQNSVEVLMEHVIQQWLMPLRNLNKVNKQDSWLHEAIALFLKIKSIDKVSYNLNRLQSSFGQTRKLSS